MKSFVLKRLSSKVKWEQKKNSFVARSQWVKHASWGTWMEIKKGKILDLKEAALTAKCCTRTIRDNAKSGKLKGQKPFNKWVFYEDDLHAWIQRKELCPEKE